MIRSIDHKFSVSRKISKHRWVLKRHRRTHFVRRKLINETTYRVKIVCPHDKVWILGVQNEMPVKKLAGVFEKLR